MGRTRQRYQTRLDPDDAAAVDEYQEKHDISQAEAVRRLIQDGLESAGENDDEPTRAEIAADLREIEDELSTDDERTHQMNQASAVTIGTVAVALGLLGLLQTLSPALSTAAYAVVGGVGALLVGYSYLANT